MSPCRLRASAIAATASPTVTSHGRPVPSAIGGVGIGKAMRHYSPVVLRTLLTTPRTADSVAASGATAASPMTDDALDARDDALHTINHRDQARRQFVDAG